MSFHLLIGLGNREREGYIVILISFGFRRTKKKKVYIVRTDKRPTPLQHYLYARNDLHKIMDSGKFLIGGWRACSAAIREGKAKDKQRGRGRGRGGSGRQRRPGERAGTTAWFKLIPILQERKLLPAVCFIFSKKTIFAISTSLTTINLTKKSEKSQIMQFFSRAISRLKGEKKKKKTKNI